jgi:mRNA-decapping enzyme subunit 2
VRVLFCNVWLVVDSTIYSHWFYEDFVRESNPQFPSLPLKKFSQIFFRACPVLHRWSSNFEIAFNNFMQYKTRVPVCGAIMLNDTWEKVCTPRPGSTRPVLTIVPQCILVKGWKSSAGWGFPKGKINQDEEPHKCAVREVHTLKYFGCLNPLTVMPRSLKRPATT